MIKGVLRCIFPFFHFVERCLSDDSYYTGIEHGEGISLVLCQEMQIAIFLAQNVE